MAKISANVLEAVGNTPLVRLNRITAGISATVCVKLEASNPGRSVKDRIALAVVEDAEKKGLLKPGGTIVEPTSGNMGVALAIVAAVKGYKCIFTIPDKMSIEKIRRLRAFGAEVVVTPTAVPPESSQSYYSVARRLADEIPGAYMPMQYDNLANREAHYASTGPEIWKQTDGKITHFVAGIGTAGTISGIAKYLKEKNPQCTVVGVDPEGSILAKAFKRETLVVERLTPLQGRRDRRGLCAEEPARPVHRRRRNRFRPRLVSDGQTAYPGGGPLLWRIFWYGRCGRA